MKADIHPVYATATVKCACGNTYQTRSTQTEIHTDNCAQCHPFFTGKQKLVDTAGRIEKFEEPVITATIITPSEHVGGILTLCQEKRGVQKGLEYVSTDRVVVTYSSINTNRMEPYGETIYGSRGWVMWAVLGFVLLISPFGGVLADRDLAASGPATLLAVGLVAGGEETGPRG